MSTGGDVVTPDVDGRCGRCGFANFAYNNGYEIAANGTRGYRCVNCSAIKPERRHPVSRAAKERHCDLMRQGFMKVSR
jgi:hypothetical protein